MIGAVPGYTEDGLRIFSTKSLFRRKFMRLRRLCLNKEANRGTINNQHQGTSRLSRKSPLFAFDKNNGLLLRLVLMTAKLGTTLELLQPRRRTTRARVVRFSNRKAITLPPGKEENMQG